MRRSIKRSSRSSKRKRRSPRRRIRAYRSTKTTAMTQGNVLNPFYQLRELPDTQWRGISTFKKSTHWKLVTCSLVRAVGKKVEYIYQALKIGKDGFERLDGMVTKRSFDKVYDLVHAENPTFTYPLMYIPPVLRYTFFDKDIQFDRTEPPKISGQDNADISERYFQQALRDMESIDERTTFTWSEVFHWLKK